MKITVMIENTSPDGLIHEHGLSMLCDYNGKRYLFDAGASDRFAKNAEKLGIDLATVDTAALSHSHFDHTGGFGRFLAENKKAKLYIRPEATERCYIKKRLFREYIGMQRPLLRRYSDRIALSSRMGRTELDRGVWLVPHSTPGLAARGVAAHMYRKTDSGLAPDNFMHEQCLVFDAFGGLVILSSCSHGGADNAVREVMRDFPGRAVRSFIGGFHLMGLGGPGTLGPAPEAAAELGEFLRDNVSGDIYTGHCTGEPAYKIISGVLGGRLKRLTSGLVIEFDDPSAI